MDLETNSMIMIKAVMAKPMRHTIDKPFMANSKKNPMIKALYGTKSQDYPLY